MQNHSDVFDSKLFAQAVKERLSTTKISQLAAASEIGVRQSTISKVLNETQRPDLVTYARICKWLGASMEQFLKLT